MKTRIDYSRQGTEGNLICPQAPEKLDTFLVDWHLIPRDLVINRIQQTRKMESFAIRNPPFYYTHLKIYLLEGVLAGMYLQISTDSKIFTAAVRPLSDTIVTCLEKYPHFKKMDCNSRQQVNDFLTIRMASHIWWYKTLAQGSIKTIDYTLTETL